MNQTNFIFGPKLPSEFERVGLAFIAAPMLASDSAIASLSAERYSPENYSHLEEQFTMYQVDSDAGQMTVDVNIEGPSFIDKIAKQTDRSFVGNVNLTKSEWNLNIPMSPLKVDGMAITKGNTWYPLIKPGNIWRNYTVSSNEPASSWLRRSGLVDGDSVVLIYSVPEIAYQKSVTSPLAWSDQTANHRLVKEIASPTGLISISYRGNLVEVKSIKINGNAVFTGSWRDGNAPGIITSHDVQTKTLNLSVSVQADDYVELEYLTYSEHYIYSGYRDYLGIWYPFNANPEYGNYIGDERVYSLRPAADCLLEQATIYALPSAYIKSTFTPDITSSSSAGTLQLDFVRAFNYNETHFVRHIIGGERKEKVQVFQGSSTMSTWGHAKFGRNYYDESGTYETDIYSEVIPSMVPLGRVVLAAPASVNSVSVADIRQRGGGVPEDFPMAAVESFGGDGLDKLRGFYDLGIWEGKAAKQGGVVEVKISSNLLKSDGDPDPTKFLYQQIYEYVEGLMPPGIEWEIKFVDNVLE